MEDLALAPPTALGVHVTERLRQRIVSGVLAPGTHLVESQLSEVFRVSRGPIRDALKQLQEEGLVESRRRGVFVLGLSEDDIEELYSLRGVLEGEALRRCVGAVDPSWAPLEDALDDMRRAAGAADVPTFAHADLEFHTALYAIAGHRRLGDVWARYEPTFAAMLAVTNAEDAGDLTPTLTDHVDLLAAVRARDATTAARLLGEHLEGSRARMTRAHGHAVGARSDAGPGAPAVPGAR